MDGFLWLILSWLLVGIVCYLILNSMGASQTEAPVKHETSSTATASRLHGGEWINDIVAWLFTHMNRVPQPLTAWIDSLNEAAKKVSSPPNCEVLFEGFGDNSKVAKPPKLSEIRVEQGPQDHLILKSTLDLPEVNLKLISSQRHDDRLFVNNLNAKIIDLHGEIESRMACIANQLYLMGCFNGRPEMDIQLQNTDPNKATALNTDIIEETIRRCLLTAVINISLSEALGGVMTLSKSDELSDKQRSVAASGSAPLQQMMSKTAPYQAVPSRNASGAPPNKLRVKIIRAQHLGKGTNVNRPYVVTEMDEPAQKFVTTKGLNMSPYWDETFDFVLTPASEEILFEIYEGDSTSHGEEPRFLGLAIVGFEELQRSNKSTHALTLQGRPYRNDAVSGTLTAQFEFLHDPDVAMIGKQVDQIVVQGPDGSRLSETVSTTRRPIYDAHDNFQSKDVTPNKTTTVYVKTVSQSPKEAVAASSTSYGTGSASDQKSSPKPAQTTTHYDEQRAELRPQGSPHQTEDSGFRVQQQQQQQHQQQHSSPARPPPPHIQPSSVEQSQRIPVQTHEIYDQNEPQKRAAVSIIDTRKSAQINRSTIGVSQTAQSPQMQGTDAKAVNVTDYKTSDISQSSPVSRSSHINDAETEATSGPIPPNRSSRDRNRKMKNEKETTPKKRERSFFGELRHRLSLRGSHRRARSFDIDQAGVDEAVSLPPSRDPSKTRFGASAHLSRSTCDATSVGNKSGESTASMYQHSTLVLETFRNGQKKYFLIPQHMVHEPAIVKFLKRGTKLHIYNEHTFVAVKISGGTVCIVCHKRIARSFTKQAYQCRDCRLVCHKACHYKTESYCTASTVAQLEIAKDIDWIEVLDRYQMQEFISNSGI